MQAPKQQAPQQVSKAPWTAPRMTRLGSAVELTQQRGMTGAMDGGANNSRTG